MANINANSHTNQAAGSGPVSAGGAVLVYRMRATDTTLGKIVFWASSAVDAAGVDYGGPGPLVNVVVQNVLGE